MNFFWNPLNYKQKFFIIMKKKISLETTQMEEFSADFSVIPIMFMTSSRNSSVCVVSWNNVATLYIELIILYKAVFALDFFGANHG